MSGTSSVGNAGVYEAGDQRTYKDGEQPSADRFHEGKEKSHNPNDPKDERSIANRLAKETKEKDEEEANADKEARQRDPTLAARNHGNEPSKGAKIDKEIADEEAEILAKKGSFGPK